MNGAVIGERARTGRCVGEAGVAHDDAGIPRAVVGGDGVVGGSGIGPGHLDSGSDLERYRREAEVAGADLVARNYGQQRLGSRLSGDRRGKRGERCRVGDSRAAGWRRWPSGSAGGGNDDRPGCGRRGRSSDLAHASACSQQDRGRGRCCPDRSQTGGVVRACLAAADISCPPPPESGYSCLTLSASNCRLSWSDGTQSKGTTFGRKQPLGA